MIQNSAYLHLIQNSAYLHKMFVRFSHLKSLGFSMNTTEHLDPFVSQVVYNNSCPCCIGRNSFNTNKCSSSDF